MAGVWVTSSSVTNVDTSVMSMTGYKSMVKQFGSGTGDNFSPVENYPGDAVRAAFIKNSISGAYSISGRFYYDGGI